jgi:hypothetical protein
MAEYQGLVDRATNVANQPYQPYTGEQVAPLTSQTLSGLGGISNYANTAQPYLGAAGAMTMGASAPVNPAQFQGMGSLAPFMNPYTSSVVDTTQAEMNNQNQQQAQFLNSANISSGAFGGDRAGIGQSILANQQQLAEAPTIAGLNQANFTQAMSDWTGQQGVNLAAQQANRSAQLAGGAQLGQIGLSAQNAGMQGAQADIQAGMIPQQEQQAIDTAAQQMYQQGQAYPFTTTGWLGNIIEGVGGQSGGQSQTTSPGPNSITQGLGAASQGLGLLTSLIPGLSDVRAKENVEEIGKTYDGQNIYRYNFKGDPRTQIGLIAQEEAYHDPGSVQRVGMGDLLGIDYERATEGAAERGHFADGGAPDQGPPPGGMTQGVTQGAGQPQQRPQAMTPDQSLMYMGDPSARAGMGSFALMGGTNMHPQPEMPIAGSRGAPPPQVPLGGGGAGLSPLGAPLEPIFTSQPQGQGSGGAWRGGRQGFQGGGQAPVAGNPAFGMATPGFQPGVDPLNDLAGVNEAVFGEETAGSKNPYYGLDFDQIQAISGGQWMPPQTGAVQPDYGNLQTSPEYGAAESSLAGQFGGGYTPGSTTLGPGGAGPTAPAANAGGGSGFMGAPAMGGIVGGARSPGAMGAAGATQGGLSRGQLSDIFSEYFGGESPAQAAPPQGPLPGHADGGRIERQMGGPTSTLALPINQGPWGVQSGGSGGGTQPAANSGGGGGPWTQMMGTPSAINPSGNAQVGMANWAGFSGPQGMMEADAEGFRADGGGVNMNGRSGFQRGGSPFTTYQPTANPARNPPTYTALDLSHLFGGGQPQQAPRAIQIQRQLGQARAKAAVQRGMVRPRVIAPDPVTGQHHDITPQPDHPSTARYPGWPTPGPGSPEGLPMSAPRSVAPVGGQDPQAARGPLQLSSRGPGMGYPARGIVPAEAAGTPEAGTLTNAAFRYPMPKQEVPARSSPIYEGGRGLATVTPPLEGTQEWNKPSTSVEEPMESREFSEAPTGRPLAAPRLVGADPMGQGHSLLAPHSMQALPPPSGDEAPMWTNDNVDIPGVFRGAGRGFTEARGGRVMRLAGGRIGFADGGDIDTSYGPQQSVSDLSDAQFGSALQDEMNQAGSGNLGWIDQLDTSSMDSSPRRAQIDPRAVAQAPSFQGAGGGGGGGPPFTQVSNMGGPPISALDLSGHYTPTTGNARGATYVPGSPGAGISPNARAQAPEHPAIKMARHIYAAGHAAGRKAAAAPNIDTSYGPQLSDKIDTSYGPQQPPAAYGHSSISPSFQGGGGVMGSSPVMNAGGYTPQGEGVTGQTSQGRGMGFGDLFGGGDRAGFASGGLSSTADPFLAEITASMPQAQGGGGHGPPAPPPPAPPPPAGQDPTKGLGDSLGKLGTAAKKFMGQDAGNQTTPQNLSPADQATMPNFTPADTSTIDAGMSGSVFDGLQDSDLGFKTGGGVGLGSLRGGFSDGGTPDTADAPSGFDLAVTGAAPVAAPTGGGAAPAVPDLIKQNFGSRAGYASTISSLESGYGKNYVGDDSSSFGPFQLHMGGLSEKYPHPGLGDEFKKQTGLDARDPKTVPQQIAFVSDYTAKHGWNDWSTKAQADKIAGGADVPSASAQPAQASTESYGGGFQLPGPSQSGPPPGQLDRSNLQAPTMGDELKHDPGGYLMSVGAAMMASRSPWLGVGIGEGLVAGNKYLQEQKELEKSWGSTQAQINNLSQEARDHGADADLKAQQIQMGALNMRLYMAVLRQKGLLGGGSTSDGSAPSGPTGGPAAPSTGLKPFTGLGDQTGSSAAPGGPGGPSGAAPAGSIPSLNDDPAYKAGVALEAQGNQQNIIRPGIGNDLITKGKAQQEAAKAAWDKKAEIAAKGQEAVTSATTEAQKPALQSYIENRQKFEQNYDQTRSEISELSNIYQHFQAGRSTEAQAELASWANAFGLKLPQAAGFDAGMKSAIQQAFAAVANSGLQKAPRAGLREATMMVASPSRDPAALRKILTDQLATLDYNHDLYQNVPGHNLSVSDDIEGFTKAHKYEDYLGKARKEIPLFKGITPETLKTTTGEDWPAPALPSGLPAGTRWSPSQEKWFDPSGRAYDQTGKPI